MCRSEAACASARVDVRGERDDDVRESRTAQSRVFAVKIGTNGKSRFHGVAIRPSLAASATTTLSPASRRGGTRKLKRTSRAEPGDKETLIRAGPGSVGPVARAFTSTARARPSRVGR